MNEIKQLKKLMEAVDKTDTPYQNYQYDERPDQYDKKTGKWSRSDKYDHLKPKEEPEEEISERQSIANEPDQYGLAIGSEGVSILTHGGEPVLEMPIEDWIGLVSNFNRNYRPR